MGEKWDNSTPRVMQKTVKGLEEMGEQLEGGLYTSIITKTTAKETAANNSIQDDTTVANLSLEDTMA
jgi:hypothetical protein